jgi:hypothetical protein
MTQEQTFEEIGRRMANMQGLIVDVCPATPVAINVLVIIGMAGPKRAEASGKPCGPSTT